MSAKVEHNQSVWPRFFTRNVRECVFCPSPIPLYISRWCMYVYVLYIWHHTHAVLFVVAQRKLTHTSSPPRAFPLARETRNMLCRCGCVRAYVHGWGGVEGDYTSACV